MDLQFGSICLPDPLIVHLSSNELRTNDRLLLAPAVEVTRCGPELVNLAMGQRLYRHRGGQKESPQAESKGFSRSQILKQKMKLLNKFYVLIVLLLTCGGKHSSFWGLFLFGFFWNKKGQPVSIIPHQWILLTEFVPRTKKYQINIMTVFIIGR